MKKILLLLAVAGIIFTGCKDDKGKKANVTMGDLAGKWSAYENIEGGKTEPAELNEQLNYMEFKTNGTYTEYDYYYNKSNEWDYTLENNIISTPDANEMLHWTISHFNGDSFVLTDGDYATRFRRSENQPLYYLEPSVNFGATTAQIMKEERRTLLKETSTALIYDKSNSIEKSVVYLLEGGKMTSAGVFISLYSDPDDLVDFLTANYTPLGQVDDLFVFESKNKKHQVVVGVEASGVLVMYTNVLSNKTKSGNVDVIEAGRQAIQDFKQAAALN